MKMYCVIFASFIPLHTLYIYTISIYMHIYWYIHVYVCVCVCVSGSYQFWHGHNLYYLAADQNIFKLQLYIK